MHAATWLATVHDNQARMHELLPLLPVVTSSYQMLLYCLQIRAGASETRLMTGTTAKLLQC